MFVKYYKIKLMTSGLKMAYLVWLLSLSMRTRGKFIDQEDNWYSSFFNPITRLLTHILIAIISLSFNLRLIGQQRLRNMQNKVCAYYS